MAAVFPGRRALENVGVWTGIRSEGEGWRVTTELKERGKRALK